MIDFKKALLTGMLALFCCSPLLAQPKADEKATSEAEQTQQGDAATQRENPVSAVPYESGRVGVIFVNGIDVKTPGVAVVNEVQNEEGTYTLLVTIEQSTQEAYNYVIGGNWDINRSFSILAEIGLGKRKSQMLSLSYRF